MAKMIQSIIRLRRDNDYNYEAIKNSFVPANGEVVLVDTANDGLRAKVGDGYSTYAQLQFTDEALHAIAKKAMERKTGARALRAILEELMLDIMYEIPKDDNIGTVTITEEYINGNGSPKIEMRATHHKEAPAPEPKKEAQA